MRKICVYVAVHWHSYHNNKGYPTDKWLCNKCFKNNYNDIVKSMAKSRNKQLDKGVSKGVGFIGEMIVAKTLGLYNCNIFPIYMERLK